MQVVTHLEKRHLAVKLRTHKVAKAPVVRVSNVGGGIREENGDAFS